MSPQGIDLRRKRRSVAPPKRDCIYWYAAALAVADIVQKGACAVTFHLAARNGSAGKLLSQMRMPPLRLQEMKHFAAV
jgi:hypothetical protein